LYFALTRANFAIRLRWGRVSYYLDYRDWGTVEAPDQYLT